MGNHQLAILMEELQGLEMQKTSILRDSSSGARRSANLDQRIRTVKSKIETLGRRGQLRVAIVKKKRWHKPIYGGAMNPGVIGLHFKKTGHWEEFTEISFWHDLDYQSIDRLIQNGRKDNEKIIERNIIDLPLGQVFGDQKDFILSWLKEI